MKYARLFCVLLLLTLLSALLLYSAYTEVRLKTVDQLNNQQTILAGEAAKGIEGFFNHYEQLLNALSHVDSIVTLDEHGKKLMEIFHQSHAGEIVAIARMDAAGRIIHALPSSPDVIGADLSTREFVQEMMKTHKPVVSDVIMAAHGFESVALHVPVFNNQGFHGSVAILIPFDHLAKRYLERIKLAQDGYAWMISRKGVELYCPVPGHVGKSVYETCKDFPTILAMADEMVQGKEGITTYFFDRVRDETVESVKKHAVYLPVHLPNNFWSIVVATPESEVLGIIHGFRDRWFLIVGIMLFTSFLCSYYLGRAFMIVKEETERKQMEAALQKSETKYRRLVELAREGIWAIDAEGNTTFVNPRMAELLGYTAEEMIGRRSDSFMGEHGVDVFKGCMGCGDHVAKEDDDFEFLRKDGLRIHARVAACPIMAGGNCIGALAVVTDLTTQKRVEEQLRESEERWHFALEGAGDGVWDWNAQTNRVFYSRQWKEMLGYEDHEIDHAFDEWDKRVHPEDKERAYIDIKNHFGGHTPVYVNEHRLLCKDGAYKWVLARGRVISRTDEGEPLRVIGTHTDITERKRVEEALQAALVQAMDEKSRSESIIAGLSDGLIIIDRDFKVVYQNDIAKLNFGSHVGENCYRAFRNRDHICEACRVEMCFGDGKAHKREVIVVKDGKTIYAEVVTSPLRKASGEVIGAVELIRDITERRQAEQAVRESEVKYRTLFESAADAIFLIRDNKFLDCNAAALRMYGCAREEIIGCYPNEFSPLVQPDGSNSKEEATRRLADALSGAPQFFEWRHRRRDGTPFDVDVNLSRIGLGDEILVLGIVRDITDRKRAESALRESACFQQQLIDALPAPVFYKDTLGRYLGCNKAYESFLNMGRDEIIGKSAFEIASGELTGSYQEQDQALLDNPGVQIYESMVRDADGSVHNVVFHKATFSRADGPVGGLIGAILDITERKRSEIRLQDSEQRLQSVIQGYPIPAFVIGTDHRVVCWNKALEEVSHIRADEVVGTKDHWRAFYNTQRPCMADLLVDETTPEAISLWYDGISNKSSLLEEAYEATDFFREVGGEGRWLHFTAAAIRDSQGALVGAIETVEDVTEHKMAEDALISANRQLNDIIEFLPDATAVFDGDKKVIAWNRAMEEMTGVSKNEMIGKGNYTCTVPFYGDRRPHLLDLIDAHDEEIASRYPHVARKGDILYAETFAPRLHGGEGAYVFATAAPLLDAHGNRVGGIESIRDITEQKQAEEALRESRQQLSDIINFLPDATFVIDGNGKVIAWSRAMEEMTGIRAEDMLGKGNYEYALPFYGERRPILIDLVLQGQPEIEQGYVAMERTAGAISGEAYMPALRGGGLYLYAKASALFDCKGNVVGAIESIRDITDRKRMEKAVVEAEAKYRSIFENALMGIFQTVPEGRFIRVNMALARMFGYDSPEEVMNAVTDISRQIYVNPERRTELLRLLEEREMVQDFEVQFYRRDKSVAWIILNIRAIRDRNGKIVHLEGIAQDITDSKLLAARLNQAQKMEAIGTLAGGIAHDFNNILAPIIGYADLSLNAVPIGTRLHQNIEQILVSGNRARDLVKQILTFSRKAEPERRPVQVSLLIKETLKLLRSSLPSTIEIRQDLDSEAMDGAVMADPSQIHQVLMNLCTNASHAMREKGGVLSIMLKNVDIGSGAGRELPDLDPGSYLKLTVADTGHGIDESVRQRIFDPYFTTKGPSEGTGLGLALVYGITKSLAGGIAVSSKPGEGTAFDVYFPRAETVQTPLVNRSAPLPSGKGLVLVIDDEKAIVDMLKEMLESLGYNVAGRYSSGDALQAFRARPDIFDLVITDLTMPHMTGTDLAKEMLKIRADTPIILCTGFSETVDENRTRLLGIKGFLMKPVALRDLAVTVNRVLSQGQPITHEGV
ncbi:MAG: PAS domain S-box protein [Syntrophobacteraceae bacterium]